MSKTQLACWAGAVLLLMLALVIFIVPSAQAWSPAAQAFVECPVSHTLADTPETISAAACQNEHPPLKPPLPEYTYVAVFAASGASSLWFLWLIMPQLLVVRWHRRKCRLALTKTPKDREREERDE